MMHVRWPLHLALLSSIMRTLYRIVTNESNAEPVEITFRKSYIELEKVVTRETHTYRNES